ncbi:type IV secretory system conjugative DNA transfer family protein, partial [Vibrio sp.]|uniref:type IV secretory system conjugative DNA transfer family protein n=1 Tax=Vibrio sp. TaxID=678 RepID=UPI003D09756D
MSFDPEQITLFAKTDARGQQVPFGIKAKDRTRHVYVIGKTGMGKSTLLENMAVQDIQNGNGLAFIDPHGQTAETLLNYIPEERKEDVLYFAPFDMEHPVSFNVMEDVGPDKRHLVVSGLMSVFEKIWVDAWSARMAYILQNTLMALLEYPDSTLLGVNRMLSDKTYRKKVVDNISDPSVKSFWVDEFAQYNERYMQEAGDAIKNKIGQFTANPLIRNIIGQPKSSFDIRKIMDDKKILIMNLSKGLVGESNANLLGSMLTTRIYLAAMSRADLTLEGMKAMPNFYFYVDEFQSFANATFADILSEARKYKLNLTIAHQYIEQMEEEVRNAVFGNVGTIISFRVGPFDAEVLETVFAPNFTATDIVNLGFAQIYLTLMIDGIGSHPFSATTLPPIEPASVSYRDVIVNRSRHQFAHPRKEVEDVINKWHDSAQADALREHQEASAAGQARSERNKGNNRGGGRPNEKSDNSNRTERSNGSDKPERGNNGPKKPKQQESKSLDELRAILG